jgi:hypothetical protein
MAIKDFYWALGGPELNSQYPLLHVIFPIEIRLGI